MVPLAFGYPSSATNACQTIAAVPTLHRSVKGSIFSRVSPGDTLSATIPFSIAQQK